MQLRGGFLSSDGSFFAKQYGSGVQTRLHLHDTDAGVRIPRHNRAVDRCGTTPARQKRCVNVQTALFWRIQHGLGQKQPIGHDHSAIGIQRGAFRLILWRAEFFRVAHQKPEFVGTCMHGSWAEFLAAPGRAWRLAIDRSNVMACCDQSL